MLYLREFRASETYKLRLFCPEVGIVECWMTAPPQFATLAEWSNVGEQIFGQSMLDSVAQATTGTSLQIGAFTFQKWQSTGPIDITFEVGFVAVDDAMTDVVEPVKKLLKFPLSPTFSKMLLKPPVNSFKGPYCSAKGGNWFVIDGLLPQNVQPEWNHVMDTSGRPLSARVTVTFKTYRAISREDIERWFK
jgi:hypothetical protein